MAYTATLVLLVFCITFALYLGGAENTLTVIQEQGLTSTAGMNALVTSLITAFGLAIVGSIGYALIGGSYSVTFAIPIIFISSFFFSFIFVPITALYALNLPEEFGYFLFGTLNILSLMAILQFIRGGNV